MIFERDPADRNDRLLSVALILLISGYQATRSALDWRDAAHGAGPMMTLAFFGGLFLFTLWAAWWVATRPEQPLLSLADDGLALHRLYGRAPTMVAWAAVRSAAIEEIRLWRTTAPFLVLTIADPPSLDGAATTRRVLLKLSAATVPPRDVLDAVRQHPAYRGA